MKRCVFGSLFVVLILAVVLAKVLVTKQSEITSPMSPYDINQDGKTNSLDCDIAYDIMQGARIATPSMLERCDINSDGLVDDNDVCLIFEAVLGGDQT